jgi:peptidase S41-like protein
MPKGTLVFRTVGRRRSANEQVLTTKDSPFRDAPLLVLIDEGSASASEAVAGSLQDHDRAVLAGRRSFGKALVMQLFPVPPQGDAVFLTVARVVTPSGRIIQRSYRGLKAEQYYIFAGRSGAEADTQAVFRTDAGREVRGGGGIMPDVVLPGSPSLPPWFAAAADSGFIEAVADSIAALLPKDASGQKAWLDATDQWASRLVAPFLDRVRSRLGVKGEPLPALEARLGRILALRATEVRFGPEAAEDFQLHNDPDIRAGLAAWSQGGK